MKEMFELDDNIECPKKLIKKREDQLKRNKEKLEWLLAKEAIMEYNKLIGKRL